MSSKILQKALITTLLIAALMVPSCLLTNLVKERENIQQQATQEAGQKWATPQVFAGPYISVPYTGKDQHTGHVLLLPQQLNVHSELQTEERSRSIYKIMFYRTQLTVNGNFLLQKPTQIPLELLDLSKASLCIGLSDRKGIEEKMAITVNGKNYDFQPGLPDNKLQLPGLSVAFPLTTASFDSAFPFNMTAHFKGSGQLHFAPLSANSSFTMASAWPSPSFDGNTLPVSRSVTDKGFSATWKFNQANLPFTASIVHETPELKHILFGVSIVKPADQYAKTMRTIKYSLLVISLTFALFFILELLQKKPVHPIQYVLVGLALIVFYTLLLSASEFIDFDLAYVLSAVATILLITLYVKGHFKTWKTAGIFTATLAVLYSYLFCIIRLEDTALLVGSIGLFMILAVIMFLSQRINWYKLDAPAKDHSSAHPEPTI
ncbi:inner membrane protein [Filimonas zeae]|uniref:Cell envelope integrity protein CreD n=1 Tax=Filimonas zeae TaxID=1737353 RepID=A0A917J1J8_9BACT|nr:cell envelope integrity protein CreD [Filimonas zeae]MDR6341423.1 inner membrane protein [Filimonas zeae]GGH75941.1 cell envelope integrity protein CreD [Filimonas zeae]